MQEPHPAAPDDERPALSARWWWCVGTLSCVGAMVPRAWVHFRNAVPATMDAGYYPVQARWLLEEGRLMLRDLPVKFALDAALAKALTWFGMGIDDAVLRASQALDIALPVLFVVPVLALAWRWSGGRWWGLVGGASAAVLAVVNPSAIRMVAEFEKNALALVWLGCAALFLHRALEGTSRAAWAWLGGMLGLSALTHIGATGAAATFAAAGVIGAAAWSGRLTWKQSLIGVASVIAALGIALGVMWTVDPSRASHLLDAPAKLFETPTDGPFAMRGGPKGSGGSGHQTPRDLLPPMSGGENDHAGTPDPAADRPFPGFPGMPGGPGGPGGPGVPGGPGGPRGFGGMGQSWNTWLCAGVAIGAAIVLVLRRKHTTAADAGVVIGSATSTLVLVCPFINPEYAMRLTLMAPATASIALAWVLCAGSRGVLLRGAGSLAAVALACASLWGPTPMPGMPSLSAKELDDLRALREHVPQGTRTLLMARHGLEFWAAYYLHVPARSGEIPDDAAAKYDRVFVLEGGAMGPMGMMMRGGGDDGGRGFPGGFPGGGPEGIGGPQGPEGPGMHFPPMGMMGGGGPPGMMTRRPAGSKMVAQSGSFRLYETPHHSGQTTHAD